MEPLLDRQQEPPHPRRPGYWIACSALARDFADASSPRLNGVWFGSSHGCPTAHDKKEETRENLAESKLPVDLLLLEMEEG